LQNIVSLKGSRYNYIFSTIIFFIGIKCTGINVLTDFDMRNTVDIIGNAADDVDDASDIARIASYKHAGCD